jgi:hypothetical protein
MHPQHHNNHDNPQMEIAMQRMVEVHTEMMRVMTQDMVNHDSKKLPPGTQQVPGARLVACKESNQALGSRKPVDWIPGPSLHCVPHAAQSTSGAGLRETSESSVSPEPPSSGAISRTRHTRGCRRWRWRELRLCGKKATGEFRSPLALPAP